MLYNIVKITEKNVLSNFNDENITSHTKIKLEYKSYHECEITHQIITLYNANTKIWCPKCHHEKHKSTFQKKLKI